MLWSIDVVVSAVVASVDAAEDAVLDVPGRM